MLYNDAKAREEGWVLSERDDGTWEIQKDDSSSPFRNDTAAYTYVAAMAKNGSDFHKEAMNLHGRRVVDTLIAAAHPKPEKKYRVSVENLSRGYVELYAHSSLEATKKVKDLIEELTPISFEEAWVYSNEAGWEVTNTEEITS